MTLTAARHFFFQKKKIIFHNQLQLVRERGEGGGQGDCVREREKERESKQERNLVVGIHCKETHLEFIILTLRQFSVQKGNKCQIETDMPVEEAFGRAGGGGAGENH